MAFVSHNNLDKHRLLSLSSMFPTQRGQASHAPPFIRNSATSISSENAAESARQQTQSAVAICFLGTVCKNVLLLQDD
jgi:hypothetical protein